MTVPIIGITGGIGSGKSFVARVLGEMGCHVIDSDAQVREAYRDPEVKRKLIEWWGPNALRDGEADRAYIAQQVFADAGQRARLEQLLHPIVNAARQREMQRAIDQMQATGTQADMTQSDRPQSDEASSGEGHVMSRPSGVLAFVWDTPLLFEAGLAGACDAVIFVDAPEALRASRVRENRGWDADELRKREKSQWPLDRKREISDYVLSNAADAASIRGQLRELFPRILEDVAQRADVARRANGAWRQARRGTDPR